VNTSLKYRVVTIALIVWLALAWMAGPWMSLHGSDLRNLRVALILIGVAAFATCLWWFKGIDEDRLEEMAEEGTAGSDEIDILAQKARARLRATSAGTTSLADLPAVLVLGEAGSAKTSVVLHGGLEAQLLAGHTIQNEIPIPTRALNLWFAAPFIVAEAGGPLLHEPPRWAHLLKKFTSGATELWGKASAPARLAVICIDCDRFVTPGFAETLGASIEQWRARLREASQVLGINLPVYVLFTRADRLQFFQDYVGPLTNDEIAGVFGAALPNAAYASGSYADQENAAVSTAFDHLYRSLAERRLTLLTRKPDPGQTPPIYEFPREFKKLRSTLVPLLVDICRPGPSRTTPFLRGFYFTGVRPQLVKGPKPAGPKDDQPNLSAAAAELNATRMMDVKKAVAAAKKMIAAEAVETRRVPQWVFLSQFFKDVLFQDSGAIATSTFSTRSGQRNKLLLGAAMGILVVLMLGFSVSSIGNKRLENQVMGAVQDLSDVHAAGRQLPSLDDLSRLEALRQSVETLANDEREGPPLSKRWGLYVGDTLLPDARRIYFQHFDELLFQPAQAALMQTLTALPAYPAPGDRSDAAFDALKAYLMTTTEYTRSDGEFLPAILLRAWAAGRNVDPARMQLAQRQFVFYAGELKSANPFPAENDTQVVNRARHYLGQFSGGERAYRTLVAQAEKSNPPVDFNHQYPSATDVVTDQAVVSGAFTKGGWTFLQGILENPAPYFSSESWVMGIENPSPSDLTKYTDVVRLSYQRDYIDRWRAFLRGATAIQPVSLGNASQQLQKLAGDQSPLLALLCVAAQNTSIDQPAIANAFQATQAVVSHDCQEQPSGPPTAAYVRSLSNLQACVDRADNATPEQKDAAKVQCLNDTKAAEQSVDQLAAGFQADPEAHADETVKDLLLAPINTVSTLLRPGPVSAAALCSQMGALESQFPFHPLAGQDVSAQQIGAIFAPRKGALSQFYSSALRILLLSQGSSFVPNPSAPQTVSPEFLTFFNRAMNVQSAFYPGGGDSLQYRYALRPVSTENVSSIALSIDGRSLSFEGGAGQFTAMNWPGASAQGVNLTVKIPGGAELGFPSYGGLWGVFRFFADATVVQHSGNVYTLQWVLGGERPVTAPNGKPVSVQFELDTQGSMPILEKGYLSNLHCVPVVAR